jgi:hypothetical protein
VALKIPEIKEGIKNITEQRGLENLNPHMVAFSGKEHLLELKFSDEWDVLSQPEKNDVLNIILVGMQKRLGDWITEVREFAI